jgi:hypothetical protein
LESEVDAHPRERAHPLISSFFAIQKLDAQTWTEPIDSN